MGFDCVLIFCVTALRLICDMSFNNSDGGAELHDGPLKGKLYYPSAEIWSPDHVYLPQERKRAMCNKPRFPAKSCCPEALQGKKIYAG